MTLVAASSSSARAAAPACGLEAFFALFTFLGVVVSLFRDPLPLLRLFEGLL